LVEILGHVESPLEKFGEATVCANLEVAHFLLGWHTWTSRHPKLVAVDGEQMDAK
jgi:hypothetical protein